VGISLNVRHRLFPERFEQVRLRETWLRRNLGLLGRGGRVFIILIFLKNVTDFKRLTPRVSSSRVQNKLCSERVQKLLPKNKEYAERDTVFFTFEK